MSFYSLQFGDIIQNWIELYICLGLDPAGPLFKRNDTENKVARGDAKFVEIIHTCAGLYGDDEQLGDADYWPNGGTYPQSGCVLDFSEGTL